MGKIYMRHGDGENALRCFIKAAEYDNENTLVHINLGFLKFKKGEYFEAAREYERALECDPEMVFAHSGLWSDAKAIHRSSLTKAREKVHWQSC